MAIEPITQDTIDGVLPLIRQYQRIYGVEGVADDNNRRYFGQFDENSPLGRLFVYRIDGATLGFARVTFAATAAEKVAVLNDLFTLPAHRRQGIARRLIARCRTYAAAQGAVRIQWVTAADNLSAQRLYESMDVDRSILHLYSSRL